MRKQIVWCMFLAAALLGCRQGQSTDSADQPATGKTFSLTIDFGDGKMKKFESLAWHEGITVLGAMDRAGKSKQGLDYSTWKDATGQSAFVEQIDGVKNEGGGEGAKNWTYTVNGKKGQVSAGIHKLKPDDAVVWKFGVYEIE
ncbi:MAG: DUF4430 domain-containing protein [Pirellulales bacterium]|nr:DUF4430 domain-containing protein [Pirellulales bacterium]